MPPTYFILEKMAINAALLLEARAVERNLKT